MFRFFSGVPFFIGIRQKQLFLYPARPHIPATNKNIISPLGMSIAQEHDNPDPFDNPDTHYAMITKIPNDYELDWLLELWSGHPQGFSLYPHVLCNLLRSVIKLESLVVAC